MSLKGIGRGIGHLLKLTGETREELSEVFTIEAKFVDYTCKVYGFVFAEDHHTQVETLASFTARGKTVTVDFNSQLAGLNFGDRGILRYQDVTSLLFDYVDDDYSHKQFIEDWDSGQRLLSWQKLESGVLVPTGYREDK